MESFQWIEFRKFIKSYNFYFIVNFSTSRSVLMKIIQILSLKCFKKMHSKKNCQKWNDLVISFSVTLFELTNKNRKSDNYLGDWSRNYKKKHLKYWQLKTIKNKNKNNCSFNQLKLYLIVNEIIIYHQDLKKREDLRNSLILLGVTPLWHVAQWVSRAQPYHTLPAFLNLYGRLLIKI